MAIFSSKISNLTVIIFKKLKRFAKYQFVLKILFLMKIHSQAPTFMAIICSQTPKFGNLDCTYLPEKKILYFVVFAAYGCDQKHPQQNAIIKVEPFPAIHVLICFWISYLMASF